MNNVRRKMVRARVRLGIVLAAALTAGTGCGGSNHGSASLRVFMASPGAPNVNVSVDGKSLATGISYGSNTGYLSVKSGSPRVQVAPVSGSSPLFNQGISIAKGVNQTLVLTGPASSIQPITLTDGGTTATAGDGHLRVLNASQNLGTADIYIVAAGTGIASVQPNVAGLAFDQPPSYQQIVAGTFEIFATTPGTKQALLDTGPLTINSGDNQTIIILDGASGAIAFSQLTDQ